MRLDQKIALITGVAGDIGRGPAHERVSRFRKLIPKAADFDVAKLGEFAGQILDVNAGSPIDVWRIFVCEEK